MSHARILLEVCVDDVAGLHAAIEGGADRIELCSALAVGGLTPSPGFMSLAGRSPVPCYAMIRPRVGNFVYSDDELSLMEEDILFAASCGLSGVVFGVSRPDGRLDAQALARLSEAAGAIPKTLHRAFDLVPDLAEAVEVAVAYGFERILTSGRACVAIDGMADLKAAIEIADGRISIMPGSGVNLETVDVLLEQLDVRELHSSCSVSTSEGNPAVADFGFSIAGMKRTDVTVVRALKDRLIQRS